MSEAHEMLNEVMRIQRRLSKLQSKLVKAWLAEQKAKVDAIKAEFQASNTASGKAE